MTDPIDVAQRRQLEEIEHSLQARRTVKVLPVRTHCVRLDCGEAIIEVRQAMHAQLCIDCQRDAELASQTCTRGSI